MRILSHLWLAAALIPSAYSATQGPEAAITFLTKEVPQWQSDNHCYSCHNNGDGARALFYALTRGIQIPKSSLADTVRWLSNPSAWAASRGNAGFKNHRLELVQFSAALAEATAAGAIRSRKPLQAAAALLVAEQDVEGSWKIDTGGVAPAPAVYGTALATYMACRTLRATDPKGYAGAIAHAEQWAASAQPESIPDRAALALIVPQSAAAQRHREILLAAQTTDGGWGPERLAPAEAFDTALVMLALAGSQTSADKPAIARGYQFLLQTQLSDGSWAETTRPSGSTSYAERVSTAAWAAYAMLVTYVPRK